MERRSATAIADFIADFKNDGPAIFWALGAEDLHKEILAEKAQTGCAGAHFHWDNSPVHNAAVVGDWFATAAVQSMKHPPHSLDLAAIDFFLFPHSKKSLARFPLTANSLKPAWVGVTATTAKEAYAAGFC